jgi:dynein heavy chain, axonemal
MGAVMTYLGEATDWASIKKTLMDSGFQKRIIDLDKEGLKKATMDKIATYTSKEDFTVANMTKKSVMAGVLTGWVRAVEDYYKAYQIVKPKKEKVAKAEAELAEKMAKIATLEAKLAELLKKRAQLQ